MKDTGSFADLSVRMIVVDKKSIVRCFEQANHYHASVSVVYTEITQYYTYPAANLPFECYVPCHRSSKSSQRSLGTTPLVRPASSYSDILPLQYIYAPIYVQHASEMCDDD